MNKKILLVASIANLCVYFFLCCYTNSLLTENYYFWKQKILCNKVKSHA